MTNKEAIKILQKDGCCQDCTFGGYPCKLVGCEIHQAIDRAIKALEETQQDEWVPVSERLPEEKINPYTTDFDEVLCTTNWGEVRAFKFGTPILHHEPHFWLGGAIMDEHIIAWQPLPEPYKKGGEV